MILKNKKKWFGFLLYGLGLTAALLYYRFPSEAFKDYLETAAGRLNPKLEFSVGHVSLSPRLGLKFQQTELLMKTGPEPKILKVENFEIRPAISSIFRGKTKICFDSIVYEGVLNGCTDFQKLSLKSPFKASLAIKDVQMASATIIKAFIGREVEGVLGGKVTFEGRSGSLIEGVGEADFTLSEGRVMLQQPILSLSSIDFSEISIKAVLKSRRVTLSKIALRSKNMRGTLTGTVNLRKDIMKSTINLKGNIEPFPDFIKSITSSREIMKLVRQRLKRGKINISVRGTLSDPKIDFI